MTGDGNDVTARVPVVARASMDTIQFDDIRACNTDIIRSRSCIDRFAPRTDRGRQMRGITCTSRVICDLNSIPLSPRIDYSDDWVIYSRYVSGPCRQCLYLHPDNCPKLW